MTTTTQTPVAAPGMPEEVVTRAPVQDVALPGGAGTLALVTLDNGHDHTRPNTFGPASIAELQATVDVLRIQHAGELAKAVRLRAEKSQQKTVSFPEAMTGAADPFTPPSITRMIARHVPDNEVVIVPECGHSPYWETPEFFNRTVLGFIRRHAK